MNEDFARFKDDIPAVTAIGRASDDRILLGVLSLVERDEKLTQRGLARELGIALGLANAYLKRCVRKGMIKVKAVPTRRYAYYLTPTGFAEKSRLTAEYLRSSLGFFRLARRQSDDLLARCAAAGCTQVVIYGASDLAEIMVLTARERGVAVAGIVDPAATGRMLLGMTVHGGFEAIEGSWPVVLADLADPQRSYDDVSAALGPDRVMVPPMLQVRSRP